MKNFVNKGLLAVFPSLLMLLLLGSCVPHVHKHTAQNGIIDLRTETELESTIIELEGSWAFFWEEFCSTENFSSYAPENADEFINVPGYWNPHVRGTGVYSVRLLLPDNSPANLCLKLSNVLQSYTVFVNGKEVFSAGRPSTDPESFEGESLPAMIPLPETGDTIDLVFNVSSWTDIYGGLNRDIFFGNFYTLNKYREKHLALDAVIFGAVIIIGIYHLAIFLMNSSQHLRLPYLFLGIVFILIALFIGCKDELLFKSIFENFSSNTRTRFIYSALVLSIPMFFCYLYFSFPVMFFRKVLLIVIGVSAVGWLPILFTKPQFFTRLLVPLEAFSIIVILYTIFAIVTRSVQKLDFLSIAYLFGYLMLVTATILGMLDNQLIVPPNSPHIMFLIFTIYQTFLQAYNTSSAYTKINKLSDAFLAMEKETEKLYDLSYVDPLTELANRRYLNEYMQKLWDRNRLTEVSFGMMMIDIDYFKLYNDRYGHMAGDECLKAVASALSDSLNRRGDLIARYGGEEFVAVIPNCEIAELERIAERLRENIEDLGIEHIDSECSESVTVSAGITTAVPSSEMKWYDILHIADTALYSAKRKGRNRVEKN